MEAHILFKVTVLLTLHSTVYNMATMAWASVLYLFITAYDASNIMLITCKTAARIL